MMYNGLPRLLIFLFEKHTMRTTVSNRIPGILAFVPCRYNGRGEAASDVPLALILQVSHVSA